MPVIVWGHLPFPFFITNVKQFTERQPKLKQSTKNVIGCLGRVYILFVWEEVVFSDQWPLMTALRGGNPKSAPWCYLLLYIRRWFIKKNRSKQPSWAKSSLGTIVTKWLSDCTVVHQWFLLPQPSVFTGTERIPVTDEEDSIFNQAVMDAAEVKGWELLINRVWKPFNAIIHIHASLTSATSRSRVDLLRGNQMYIYSYSLRYLICPNKWMRCWWQCRGASPLECRKVADLFWSHWGLTF